MASLSKIAEWSAKSAMLTYVNAHLTGTQNPKAAAIYAASKCALFVSLLYGSSHVASKVAMECLIQRSRGDAIPVESERDIIQITGAVIGALLSLPGVTAASTIGGKWIANHLQAGLQSLSNREVMMLEVMLFSELALLDHFS
jgi:hypothetical protein